MKYESIIFDIDGTLWDSRALVAEGYNIQLRKEGLHHLQTNADVLLQLFGRTMSGNRLSAMKHRLFIVSNGQKGYPQLAAQKLGVAPLITGYLSYGDTGTHKGETIRILMKEHSIENAVYVGDTQGDYEATVDAGIDFIWADYGFGKPDACNGTIHCFKDLLNL